jgi:hypothetical protein
VTGGDRGEYPNLVVRRSGRDVGHVDDRELLLLDVPALVHLCVVFPVAVRVVVRRAGMGSRDLDRPVRGGRDGRGVGGVGAVGDVGAVEAVGAVSWSAVLLSCVRGIVRGYIRSIFSKNIDVRACSP